MSTTTTTFQDMRGMPTIITVKLTKTRRARKKKKKKKMMTTTTTTGRKGRTHPIR
jgi:hypothetical protein